MLSEITNNYKVSDLFYDLCDFWSLNVGLLNRGSGFTRLSPWKCFSTLSNWFFLRFVSPSFYFPWCFFFWFLTLLWCKCGSSWMWHSEMSDGRRLNTYTFTNIFDYVERKKSLNISLSLVTNLKKKFASNVCFLATYIKIFLWVNLKIIWYKTKKNVYPIGLPW